MSQFANLDLQMQEDYPNGIPLEDNEEKVYTTDEVQPPYIDDDGKEFPY